MPNWNSCWRVAILYSSLALMGCGGAPIQSADSRQLALQALEKADSAFNERKFDIAAEHFAEAIEHGLNADNYALAAMKRSVCWGAAGKHQEALAELDKLEAGAPNLDQVYAARSYVLAKQGKVAESRAALAKARQLNRSVQEFKD